MPDSRKETCSPSQYQGRCNDLVTCQIADRRTAPSDIKLQSHWLGASVNMVKMGETRHTLVRVETSRQGDAAAADYTELGIVDCCRRCVTVAAEPGRWPSGHSPVARRVVIHSAVLPICESKHRNDHRRLLGHGMTAATG